jgi:hypothetical protein
MLPFSLRGQLDHEQAFVTARIEPGKVIAAAINPCTRAYSQTAPSGHP